MHSNLNIELIRSYRAKFYMNNRSA